MQSRTQSLACHCKERSPGIHAASRNMKDVRASVALLQLRPKAASNDCLVVCCLYSPAYLVRALWLLGVWPRDTVQPGNFSQCATRTGLGTTNLCSFS